MRQKCVKIKNKNPENTEISMFSGFITLYFVIQTRKGVFHGTNQLSAAGADENEDISEERAVPSD